MRMLQVLLREIARFAFFLFCHDGVSQILAKEEFHSVDSKITTCYYTHARGCALNKLTRHEFDRVDEIENAFHVKRRLFAKPKPIILFQASTSPAPPRGATHHLLIRRHLPSSAIQTIFQKFFEFSLRTTSNISDDFYISHSLLTQSFVRLPLYQKCGGSLFALLL